MDQTLNLKLNEFRETLNSLEVALKEEKNDLIRDSVIKRFEYNFELCWKTAKVFLSQKFGVDIFSPKECFRELRRNKLLSDKETELLLKMQTIVMKLSIPIIKIFQMNCMERLKKIIIS